MTPLRRFAIHRPADLREAAAMLDHYGETASLYAGGTELLLAMRHDLLRYENLIDVKAVPGLDGIERRGSHLHIGAAATHRNSLSFRSATLNVLLRGGACLGAGADTDGLSLVGGAKGASSCSCFAFCAAGKVSASPCNHLNNSLLKCSIFILV